MKRRTFLRTGFAAGLTAGVGGIAALPAAARPRAARAPAAPFPRARRAVGPADPIHLDSNENPLGLPASAREAVTRGLVDAHRYPDVSGDAIRSALAEHLGVAEEALILGAGSTDVLRMAVQALGGPGASLVTADPTFEDVTYYAGPLPFRVERVPLDGRLAHDLDGMRARAEATSGPVFIYICNPNNPTGTLTPSADVEAWIREAPEGHVFLVDEAYFEFAEDPGYRSCLPLVAERPNLVVVRTFSKVYGMAGLRLGYGIAHPRTAERVRRFRTRNIPNHAAAVAGVACLKDPEHVRLSLETNRRAREVLYRCLDELGLDYIPSHTNFVMHRVPGDLAEHIGRMRERDVWIGRPFPPMLSHSRVSIGLPEEMERFAELLRDFRRRGWV